MPVESGVGIRDERPYGRVRSRFAGEVTGVKLRDGGVDVVGVERYERCDPVFGVDLDEL